MKISPLWCRGWAGTANKFRTDWPTKLPRLIGFDRYSHLLVIYIGGQKWTNDRRIAKSFLTYLKRMIKVAGRKPECKQEVKRRKLSKLSAMKMNDPLAMSSMNLIRVPASNFSTDSTGTKNSVFQVFFRPRELRIHFQKFFFVKPS